jgi:hypothetical protein
MARLRNFVLRRGSLRSERSGERRLVGAEGFEPANRVFSSLLIIAFLNTYLQVSLRQYTSDCMHYFESVGN